MNVVFLSPHFPPNWFRFAAGLRAAGANVLGITDMPTEQLSRELRDALTDHYRVDALHRYDQLIRAMGWFIHRHGRIHRLDSLNEHWLEVEAELRSDFDIPGLDRRTIGVVKRKSLMKRRFQRAGLRVARGRVCRTPAELKRFVAEVGYPVVAKPDIGVGAVRTYKLTDGTSLESYLRDKPPIDYIVEEFIPGRIVTYDGMVDAQGRVVFDSTLTYSTGVMDSVLGADIYYYIPREIPADVQAAGHAIIKAYDLRERPFHFEFFRTPDGGLVTLEANMRPPGGLTVDMFDWANDIDFYREWANVVVSGRFEAAITRPYCCLYAGRKDSKRYLRSHDDVLREFGPLIVHHERMSGVFATAIGDHGYVMRHPDLEPLIAAAGSILEKA